MFNLFVCALPKTRVFERESKVCKVDKRSNRANDNIVIFEL